MDQLRLWRVGGHAGWGFAHPPPGEPSWRTRQRLAGHDAYCCANRAAEYVELLIAAGAGSWASWVTFPVIGHPESPKHGSRDGGPLAAPSLRRPETERRRRSTTGRTPAPHLTIDVPNAFSPCAASKKSGACGLVGFDYVRVVTYRESQRRSSLPLILCASIVGATHFRIDLCYCAPCGVPASRPSLQPASHTEADTWRRQG